MNLANVGLSEPSGRNCDNFVQVVRDTSITLALDSLADLIQRGFDAAERVCCTLYFPGESFPFAIEVQQQIRAGEG